MAIYDDFKQRYYPGKQHWAELPATSLAAAQAKLPADIAEFLANEGISSYANHFLWTTDPELHHGVLSAWGLQGADCHAFMRTAFGALIYNHKQNFYYLDPLEGRIVAIGDDPYLLLNVFLILDAILVGGLFRDYFENLSADPQTLQPDTIFGFFPALPIGGSFASSKIEVVQLTEHLYFLAQLFGSNARFVDIST